MMFVTFCNRPMNYFRREMSFLKIEVDHIMSIVLHQLLLQITRPAHIWNCMHVPLKKMLKFLKWTFYRIVSLIERFFKTK